MRGAANRVLKEVGLDRWPPFVMDRLFWIAIAGGMLVWILLWLTVAPMYSIQGRSILSTVLASIIYYPLLEEILFRGVIQGQLSSKSWGNKKYLSFTTANWVTSLLFVGAHFWYQPVFWAIVIIVPSLVYGFFRDRYSNTYPSIILHAFYNGGFVLVNFMTQ